MVVAVGHGHLCRDHGQGLAAVVERDPFAALADPTRRQIVEMLAGGGPSTATGLAGDLDMTRQAVAKHLLLLADAGLLTSKRVGRETRFEATLVGLADVRRWMEQVENQWGTRLSDLASSLESPD